MNTTVLQPRDIVKEQNYVGIDPLYEFDAPRYYDFEKGTPSGSATDEWFFTSATKGAPGPVSLQSCCLDVRHSPVVSDMQP